MRKPRALGPGDRLAIVAPASPFTREEFDSGVQEIRRLGFEPVYDDTVFARQRYVAGAPELRAAAIHAAWRDPSIAGVIGVRGGYGSAQILPLLDREEARRVTKPFIGYSDLTSMLTFLTIGCDLVAFHGPMLAGRLGRGASGYDEASFVAALTRTEPMGELAPSGLESVRAGDATFHAGGTLHSAGANGSSRTREVLTVIYYAAGTRTAHPANDNQRTDLETFLPGVRAGDEAKSALNPVLYP